SAAPPTGSTSQRFTHYPNDRLKDEFGRNANEQIAHRYDAAGNPIEDRDVASNHTVTSDYYLDGLPRTVTSGLTGSAGDSTAYGYNGVGLPISRAESGTQAHNTTYRYNDAGLLDQLTSDLGGANTWTWKYDAAGRPFEENAPNGYKVTKTWRADDTLATQRLVNNAQTVLADWTYHHDELYRQKSQDFTGKNANDVQTTKNFTYTYWPTGELKAFNDGTTTHNLTWDPDGNRLTFGNNITAKYNADDSIHESSVNGTTTTFEYLPFGGVLRDGACNVYDGFDRLTSIRPADSDLGRAGCEGTPLPNSIEYSYDALDRQRSRKTPVDNKTTTFRYDGRASNIAGEKRDATIFSYLIDPAGGKQAVSQTGTPGTEFLFDDGYGNLSTVAQNGNVKCAVRYNPFGEPINPQNGTLINGDNPCHSGSTMGKAFYRGGRRDESTGRYQLGSRTYDPKTSSFLTPDHYRAGGSDQNLSVGVDPLTRNSYSYVNGDPVNLIDPDGHDACRMEETREAQLQCVNARSQERGGRGVRYFETKGGTTIYREPDGFAYRVTKGQGIDRRDITPSWQWEHGSPAERAYAAYMYGCAEQSCKTPRTGSRLWNIAVEFGKSIVTDPIDCVEGLSHLDPRFECVSIVPAGKPGKLGKTFLSGNAAQAVGSASRFSIHSRVIAQLDDVRLGPLAGRFGPDDLQGLLHAPSAKPYFDTATGYINVMQEIDGVLLRVTTAADDFRIISVGRLREAQLRNGIANGRFVPIGSGG
ncbi:MAG TPA: RHS repeat-associated core domain-containing protein, partial [Acidimicrobiia bacterium]|nr:RHS repeat-associated core domain-containing protein [Acidimicrobiia bacterium]